jgi:hypothetical protein
MAEKSPFTTTEVIIHKDGFDIPREIRVPLVIREPNEPGTLVLPGIGQDGRIPSRIATLTDGVDVASALPYWEVPAEEASIRALAQSYPAAVIEAWREAHDDPLLVANMVAESQAAIGTIYAEADNPQDFEGIVLLRPLGLNVEQMGDTSRGRAKKLLGRAAATLFQGDQSVFQDRWNAYAASRLLHRISRHTLTQLGIGLSEDMIPLLTKRTLARSEEGKLTALLVGGRDKMMQSDELLAARERVGASVLDLIFIEDASHRSLATRRGAGDLQAAVSYLQQ